MVTRHILSHGIDLRLETTMKEIIAGPDGRACAVLTDSGERIEAQLVGLTAGVSPNIAFLKDSGIECQRGVLIDRFFRTNVEDVYAIGDCAEFREALPGRRPVEQVWYSGRDHGQTLADTLCGNTSEYRPGPWFNSAKFLDLEWQTYGDMPAQIGEDLSSLYWEHPTELKAVHLLYRKSDKRFVGINSLGIRYRHLIFDRFLRDERTIEYVLENLAAANFDPEFSKTYERDILDLYNRQTGSRLQPRNKRGLRGVLQLLKSV